jgi:putative heme-binding domain-containing protein
MPSFVRSSSGARRFVFCTASVILAAFALIQANKLLWSADENQPAAKLEIHPGDHICIIGNTLADRMQHDGWFETYLYSRFPKDNLVIRDLGFSGDEVNERPRSQDFGSPDQHLTIHKADVVLAFFGYNESFAGAAGLDNFKRQLDGFIKHTLSQKYNGQSAPRLALFSPIAHEDLHNRNLPDGSQNNVRLELYTAAMSEVAKANHVPMVDLYDPTIKAYLNAPQPLTINGVHLTPHGDEVLAQIADKGLFPSDPQPQRDAKAMEKLREAVADKDFYWFERYRTVDGFSIYGGRADLSFVDRQTNRVVAAREMEVLDIMTANRDKRIWAVAQGGDLKLDDSNTPPFLTVKTNKPGKGPNGTHIFLDTDAEIKTMTVAKGMRVNAFASEKDWPELVNPVQMTFDPKGRLWVAVWPTYPHWKPKEEMNDKLLILEDTKGTGHADKCTVFADHLHCPTGFELYNGGVLVAQAPDVMFLKDSTGGDHCDTRIRILDGIDSADTHHTANSFTFDPGGALYFQEGTFMHTAVETPWAPVLRNADAGVYRYEPRTQKFEAYVTYGFANPHGHAWNRWAQDIVVDGTGAQPYNGALFSGHLDYPEKHQHPPQVYNQRTRPCPGIEFLSSRHFPPENQGNLLVANVIGFQGILQYKIEDEGSSIKGTEVEPILSSTDENFRPTDIKIGPDGAIYFLDWQNPIIGHMQHNLRDPSRDRTHGRIYRVVYESRPLLKPVEIAGQSIEKLLDLLKEPEDRVRYRTRIELSGRDSDAVIAAADKWIKQLDTKDPNYEHNRLEGLWLHQAHNVVDVDLLKQVLKSPDSHARAAATRVLCYWRDRVPEALDLLKVAAADPAGQVRLEAVRAASFFRDPQAVEIALISTSYPSDQYLDFVRNETMRALDPYVKRAIAAHVNIPLTDPVAARYFLKNVTTNDLLKMQRNRAVYLELLLRAGVRDEFRHEALIGLANQEHKSELAVVLDAIREQDQRPSNQDESVLFDLVRMLTDRKPAELAASRGELEDLALQAKLPVTRQLGFVALIAADGSIDPAWNLATKSVKALEDLVSSLPLVRDPGLRASIYPKVEPLLKGLPASLGGGNSNSKMTLGRYVRIELPGSQRTLTLAEVEVFSDGHNVARQGKASQKNTGYGGDASRAIDGDTSGNFGHGTATHTAENTSNPWWEVDLGSEMPIDAIAIFNRTDGDYGKRLDGFTLKVLDSTRNTVFEKTAIAAPAISVRIPIGGGSPEHKVRRAAMLALASVRGQETAAFKVIAPYVGENADRMAAMEALRRIPTSYWPKDDAPAILKDVLTYVKKVPVRDRTSPAVLDALQLGDSLASLLPSDDAKRTRAQLGELGVRVVHLSAMPEKMAYDKEQIAVQAGKTIEIVFENDDLMPHNFVVIKPGSLEEVGMLGETTGTQSDAGQRQFVPPSNKVLFHSNLLQPRAIQRLSFTAPRQPGVYPFVCTFPGHWRRMYGAMYVVNDLDGYLAGPEDYLKKHPLAIADGLLKFNRPRTEWKFDDLAPLVAEQVHGRSYANGKQLFTVASCIACHQLNGVGKQFGPDLTKIDPKHTPVDVFRDIIEPSFRIDEKYSTYIISTDEGKIVTGLIVEETPDLVKLVENPLVKCDPTILKKSSIVERKKSPVSLMPKGLLDKLTRDEILDLVAYVYAHGDPQNKLFRPESTATHSP